MARRTSRAVKKDTAATADIKNEGEAPRRSGRATSKPENSPKKEASRSRRSSTAAQTAASVADSKSPRTKVSSRRESASPTDTRTRSGRSGVESPATRVKSTRRSTSKINYKESDGEEEAPTPKFDENFESGEEFEDSESDEKSKPQARGRSSRTPAKGRVSTPKSKGSSQSRKTKSKQKDEEECETVDVSDESMETEEKKEETTKEPLKPTRSRRQKSEVKLKEEKPKPSRKSGRASSGKEETPASKRPSRSSVQAKRYTEEEEEDVEEVDDTKTEEDADVSKEEESRKKRKRDASPEEGSKRLKEEDTEAKKPEEEEEAEDDKSVEEPMEVEETDSASVPEPQSKTETIETPEAKETKSEEIAKSEEDVDEDDEEEQKESLPSDDKLQDSTKQKIDFSSSESIVEKPEIKEGSQLKAPVEMNTEEAEKETISQPEPIVEKEDKPEASNEPQSPETIKTIEDSSKTSPIPLISESTPSIPKTKSEETIDKVELPQDSQAEPKSNAFKNDDSPASEEGKPLTIDETSPDMSPKELEHDTSSANGPQMTNDVSHAVQDNSNKSPTKSEYKEQTAPTENGAHNDVQHNNLTPPTEQYYLLPGRKYITNSKLSENILQSVKSKTFGFVSYNLGASHSDGGVQKEKLLNELNTLDARIICLQQVARPFYTTVLEPSLDALGFKGIFSQPEDSLKGMATFYKSSLFRFAGSSNISLRKLIEKDIETSSLGAEDRNAVKSIIKKCGNVLFAHLSTVIGTQSITVANVQIPPADLSVQALQVSCIAREVVRINSGTSRPLLLGGEFNISEKDASYQLLRDGYLSNEMIEELQQRKDIVLEGKENASLVNLLWKSFQHPSSNLCSCYSSVLEQEFFIPELKRTSSDLLWYSSDSLHTVGVLDVASDKPVDHHLTLKADIAFSV